MSKRKYQGDAQRKTEHTEDLCTEFGKWPNSIDFDSSDKELEAFYTHAEACPYHAALVEQSNSSFAQMIREVEEYLQPAQTCVTTVTTCEETEESYATRMFMHAFFLSSACSPENSTTRLMEKRRLHADGLYEIGCLFDSDDASEGWEVLQGLGHAVSAYGGRVIAKKDECEPQGWRLVLFRFAGTERTITGLEQWMEFTYPTPRYHWLDSVESMKLFTLDGNQSLMKPGTMALTRCDAVHSLSNICGFINDSDYGQPEFMTFWVDGLVFGLMNSWCDKTIYHQILSSGDEKRE
jgi:hypothetical protein